MNEFFMKVAKLVCDLLVFTLLLLMMMGFVFYVVSSALDF